MLRVGVGAAGLLVILPLLHAHAADAPTKVPAAPARVQEWVIHFDREFEDVNAHAYGSLLRALPDDARVTVVVPEQRDALAFRFAVPIPEGVFERLTFLPAGRPMSTWARDRYVIFERAGQRCLLLQPRADVEALWRADLDAAAEIALRPASRLRRLRTDLSVEGGDLLLTARTAFVGIGTIRENAARRRSPDEAIERELARLLGRRLVVVGRDPAHTPHDHLDMYVHALEDGSVVLGDPRVAAARWDAMHADAAQHARLTTFGPASAEEQRLAAAQYDEIAEQLERRGVRVHRVPAAHMSAEDVILTYTNVVTERRRDGAWVYLPSYGLPALDGPAATAWQALGFRVKRIACAEPAFHGGAVRCLTNVIRAPGSEVVRPTAGAKRPAVRAPSARGRGP